MFFLKKIAAKRVLKKNVRSIESAVKRAYKDVSKDLSKGMTIMRRPLKVTISR